MHGTPPFANKNSTQILKTLRKIKYCLLSIPIAKPLAKYASKKYQAALIAYLHANHLIAIKYLYPDLAIIDGVKAMEGEGPGFGTPIDLGITLVSTDALCVDLAATKIMGLKVSDIAYLEILKNRRRPKYKIIGPNPQKFRRKFKLHPNSPVFKISKEKVLKLLNSKRFEF